MYIWFPPLVHSVNILNFITVFQILKWTNKYSFFCVTVCLALGSWSSLFDFWKYVPQECKSFCRSVWEYMYMYVRLCVRACTSVCHVAMISSKYQRMLIDYLAVQKITTAWWMNKCWSQNTSGSRGFMRMLYMNSSMGSICVGKPQLQALLRDMHVIRYWQCCFEKFRDLEM